MTRFSFEKPKIEFPLGSWDCHVHVFGDPLQFPFAGDRRYTPMRAEVSDLRQHLDVIGAERAVIVQASPYGTDNRCLLNALDEMQGRAVGVASLSRETQRADQALQHMHGHGVRGARLQLRYMTGTEALTALDELTSAVAGSGWHVEVNLRRDQLSLIADSAESKMPAIVLDHFADMPEFGSTVGSPEQRQFLRAMETGRVWVKLSAPFRVSGLTSPAALVPAIVSRFPDRCVWGSDWPHTPPHGTGQARLEPARFKPVRAAEVTDELFGHLPRERLITILRDNPAKLYA